ncbi:transport protein [Lacticaseibacillus pantheris DSM 15945 = JCM 12539 = NBRC 106106]|uniref:Transport protein n=1 Tax=Lacticaseibacillus pantheris DSM 15945 = JCM 12539 = NBRC 106106 TaxID=1423783 RepID=A0A0R1TXH5_9LACO|nr:MFS transporter [Lacticaseibacillus pantheris]KRL85847.1 transport protein [Lacticaseibacillus pantheris DSM 15945 = JCM 12539 = NBRC 106106]
MHPETKSVPTKTKLSILAVGLLSFVGILVETSMNVTFPTLIKTMGVTLDTVQWLTTAYLLVVTIVMSTTAYMLKRFNPRPLFLYAVAICLIGGLLCLFAPSFPILLAGRLLQAVATGISTPLMFQIIFARVPHTQLGVYTGFASVIVSLAPALGPTYGGVLTSIWSWRAVFIGILPLLVIIAALGATTITGKAAGVGQQRFDYLGMVILAALFAGIVLAFNGAGTYGWTGSSFWLWLAGSIVIALVFAIYARKGTRKLLNYRILKLPVLRLRLLAYFGLQFINIGLSLVLPLLAQTVLGASAMTAGLMLLPGALVGAVTAPLAGRVYDRVGATIPLLFSSIMVCVALTLLWVFTDSLTVVGIAGLYVVLRLGFNSGFGVAISDGSMQVSGTQKSDQNSLFSMMQQYAGSLGTSVMSAVIAAFTLSMTTTSATVLGAEVDFALLLVLGFGILLATVYTRMGYTDN